MTSGSGTLITPRDFNQNTQDPNRDEWQAGAMRHLVAALDGRRVAIVCDKQTGFAEVDVTLGGVRQSDTAQVLVQRRHSDGTTGGCWYNLFSIGPVLQLDPGTPGQDAWYTAWRAYTEEKNRAVRLLQDEMMQRLGIAKRDDLPKGKWDGRSLAHGVHASYDPQKYGTPAKYTWKSYSARDLAPAE